MTQDATPRAAPSGLEPAASLTSVRVKRRKLPVAPTGKRGDLTAEGAASHEPARAAGPSPSVIDLPPPLDAGLRQEMLPLVEIMLPELVVDEPAHEEPHAAPAAPEHETLALLPAEPEPLELLLAPPDETETQAETAWAAPALPEPPPEPRPALTLVEAPSAAVPEPAPAVGGEPDLLDYWDSLRGGRDFPALDELDCAHVGAAWPNTVLLAVGPSELPRITRLGESNGEIEYTATVIDWIMSRGRNSVKRGEPMEEEHRFPVSTGSARYRLLLLPLSSYGLTCDHVLCQLTRVQERSAVASLRRWLTG